MPCARTSSRRRRRSGSGRSVTLRRSRTRTRRSSRAFSGCAEEGNMTRVKRSVHARKKRRKVLDQASGYWGLKHSSYKRAKEQVEKSLVYAYRDRKTKKRMLRRLWIVRINAAARQHDLSYN